MRARRFLSNLALLTAGAAVGWSLSNATNRGDRERSDRPRQTTARQEVPLVPGLPASLERTEWRTPDVRIGWTLQGTDRFGSDLLIETALEDDQGHCGQYVARATHQPAGGPVEIEVGFKRRAPNETCNLNRQILSSGRPMLVPLRSPLSGRRVIGAGLRTTPARRTAVQAGTRAYTPSVVGMRIAQAMDLLDRSRRLDGTPRWNVRLRYDHTSAIDGVIEQTPAGYLPVDLKDSMDIELRLGVPCESARRRDESLAGLGSGPCAFG